MEEFQEKWKNSFLSNDYRYFPPVIVQSISHFDKLGDIISNFRLFSFCLDIVSEKGTQDNQEKIILGMN